MSPRFLHALSYSDGLSRCERFWLCMFWTPCISGVFCFLKTKLEFDLFTGPGWSCVKRPAVPAGPLIRFPSRPHEIDATLIWFSLQKLLCGRWGQIPDVTSGSLGYTTRAPPTRNPPRPHAALHHQPMEKRTEFFVWLKTSYFCWMNIYFLLFVYNEGQI